MQDPTHTAREHLKGMPDEVFDLWIKHLISVHGWPFDSLESVSSNHFKRYFFELSLQEVSQLQWHLRSVPRYPDPFHPISKKHLQQMISYHVLGMKHGLEVPSDSDPRFIRCRAYIEEHGKFPFPIVVYDSGDGFKILDGHHRLTAMGALVYDGKILPFDVECWIGQHSKQIKEPEQDGGGQSATSPSVGDA